MEQNIHLQLVGRFIKLSRSFIPTLRFLSLYLIIVISCFSCDGLVSNRLSRESSQDILVEDIDRLSTTSAMSESSVSHRLNDVQDVQDIARMQEESE